MTNWLTKCILTGIVLVLTSSCHTIQYTARYEIKSKNAIPSQRQTAESFIKRLALKYGLEEDPKNNHTDTLAYYGSPYHYFKFKFNNSGPSEGTITLDYWGMSSRKDRYQAFLTAVTDSIQTHFILLQQDTKETK